MISNAHRIPVSLSRNSYEVVIQSGGLNHIGEHLQSIGFKTGTKILVVTNPDVAKPYSKSFLESLRKSGFNTNLLVIDAGEAKKNQKTVLLIHDAAFKAKLERGSLMIALGGGVVGDMTGFAAATWLRGIAVVQVPTTLLAMVDAAIGGKTGVNHIGGKNLIGAFHQPKLVLIDPHTLNTLPSREFAAGISEVIKYGVIGDNELFEMLEKEKSLGDLNKLKTETLDQLLIRSATSKARIVVQDEYEGGIRAKLNYGHTFGHVIETVCGYGTWLHGEAVSMGMVAAGELALQIGLWKLEDAKRQKELLNKSSLPINWPEISIKDVLRVIEGDKKVKDGKIRFILPSKIGQVEILDNINTNDIKNLIKSLNH